MEVEGETEGGRRREREGAVEGKKTGDLHRRALLKHHDFNHGSKTHSPFLLSLSRPLWLCACVHLSARVHT